MSTVRSIQVCLTNRCNLACQYCYLPRARGRESPRGRLVRAVEHVLRLCRGHVEVTFTGGEPLLALPLLQGLVQRIESAPPPGLEVTFSLVTNGTRLDEGAIEFLEQHRFSLDLSFDGVAEAQALRAPGTFRQLDRVLDLMREQHQELFENRLQIRITLSPAAVPHLAHSVQYLLEKDSRRIVISPASGTFAWPLARVDELRAQFSGVVALSRDVFQREKRLPVVMFRGGLWDLGSYGRDWACGAASGEGVTIDRDGKVYACTVGAASHRSGTAPLFQSALRALALGRAGSGAFPERLARVANRIRSSGAFTRPDLRYSSYRRCADCEYLPRCYACPLAAAHDPTWTDVRRVPDFVCAFNQVTLEARDAFWRLSGNRGA